MSWTRPTSPRSKFCFKAPRVTHSNYKRSQSRRKPWKQKNRKNPEEKCGRMTHTGVDHCLGLLRGARRNVGQSPGCLKLERRTAGERHSWSRSRQRFSDHSFQCGVYLSSLSRQFTSLGRIPDLMRSSIGGLRSLDSSFLEKILKQKHLSHMHTRSAKIIQTINLTCNKISGDIKSYFALYKNPFETAQLLAVQVAPRFEMTHPSQQHFMSGI